MKPGFTSLSAESKEQNAAFTIKLSLLSDFIMSIIVHAFFMFGNVGLNLICNFNPKAVFVITFSDANTNPPQFQNTPYSVKIFEDVPIGTTVLNVLATDQVGTCEFLFCSLRVNIETSNGNLRLDGKSETCLFFVFSGLWTKCTDNLHICE